MGSNFEQTRFLLQLEGRIYAGELVPFGREQSTCISKSIEYVVTGVPVRQPFMNDFDWPNKLAGLR
jgi:hypothetical protein